MGRWDNDEKTVSERLAGAVVESVEAGEDRIKLVTSRGTLLIDAEGDCCSSSFFLNYAEVNELAGKTMTSVSERPEDGERIRDGDEECRQEVSRWYGIDLNYVGGSVYLEMRNDSNGYYGGEFTYSWMGEE